MPDNKTEKLGWSSYWMIRNAKSLQEVANHLDADMELQSDSFLFHGIIMTAPILMALATEIALKALQCQEQEEPPKRPPRLVEIVQGFERRHSSPT